MMDHGTATIEWAGETLVLFPERAVWWERGQTLFIADPHFGKAATFRFAGIAVPETTHDDDLARLSSILNRTAAARLVILGDFFHAKTGRSAALMSSIAAWRARHSAVKFFLVLGNHDRSSGDLPFDWDIEYVHGPWPIGPFACRHEPVIETGEFGLCGHVHPSIKFKDRIGCTLSGPCFYFSEQLAILPAFGSFTGTHAVRPKSGERVFLIGDDSVLEMSLPSRRR